MLQLRMDPKERSPVAAGLFSRKPWDVANGSKDRENGILRRRVLRYGRQRC